MNSPLLTIIFALIFIFSCVAPILIQTINKKEKVCLKIASGCLFIGSLLHFGYNLAYNLGSFNDLSASLIYIYSNIPKTGNVFIGMTLGVVISMMIYRGKE